MATEITGYILISKNSLDSFIFHRDIRYIVTLDEGHDRPSWVWVKNNRSTRSMSQAWVPERPATILRDGLLMVLAEGIKNENIREAIASRQARRSVVIDLNYAPVKSETYTDFPEYFVDYDITVVAFPGSSLLTQVEEFSKAGLSITLLSEQAHEVQIKSV